MEEFYNGVIGIWTWFLPFSAEIDGFYGVLGEEVDVGWIGFWEVLLGLGWGGLLGMGDLAWLMAYLGLVFIILNQPLHNLLTLLSRSNLPIGTSQYTLHLKPLPHRNIPPLPHKLLNKFNNQLILIQIQQRLYPTKWKLFNNLLT